jgi:large subunit ribosomal protein L10
MNREQKSAAIAEIAGHIDESDAVFAVDYRGITVAQVAELRAKLRDADATFRVVKNSLTERAADQAGAEALKDFLAGPTALTFVRGDVAVAAKAVADYARATQLLPFKGGLMDGDTLDGDQIRALSRLPSREVLYGQLVGVVASPVSGLVRSLAGLLGGLAVALGQVREKKEAGEIPAGAEPAAPAGESPAADAPDAGTDASPGEAPAADAASGADASDAEGQASATEEQGEASGEGGDDAASADAGAPEAEAAAEPPADDNQSDVSAEAQTEDAETSPKED